MCRENSESSKITRKKFRLRKKVVFAEKIRRTFVTDRGFGLFLYIGA